MRYDFSFYFELCNTSFHTTHEEISAKDAEIAIKRLRERHPNKNLKITTVRELRNGEWEKLDPKQLSI